MIVLSIRIRCNRPDLPHETILDVRTFTAVPRVPGVPSAESTRSRRTGTRAPATRRLTAGARRRGDEVRRGRRPVNEEWKGLGRRGAARWPPRFRSPHVHGNSKLLLPRHFGFETHLVMADATPASPPLSAGKAFSPSRWSGARAAQNKAVVTSALSTDRADQAQQRASLIEKAFGVGTPFGGKVASGTSKTLGDCASLLDCESGLLIAVLSLFDANGSRNLSEEGELLTSSPHIFHDLVLLTRPSAFACVARRVGARHACPPL